MSGEYQIHLQSGLTVYALIFDENRTKIWTGAAFVAISSVADADWADGKVACTEQLTSANTGTGLYVGDRPSGVSTRGLYLVEFYNGTPTPGDQHYGILLDQVTLAGTAATITSPTFMTIKVAIADWLGLGRNTEGTGTAWSDDDSYRLDEAIRSGYWRVIYNAILPGENTAHRWSFMRPKYDVNTVASDWLYDLPADFGAIASDIVYDSDESISQVIRQTSPGYIDRRRAVDPSEGQPSKFAIRPKSTAQTAEQTQELMLYPTPDAAYGLILYYDVHFADLSAVNLYPLGGAAHRDTILQSCRDVATQFFRETDVTLRQLEHQTYLERLQASVEYDRRNAPAFLGFNNDGLRSRITRHGSDFAVTLTHNLGGG